MQFCTPHDVTGDPGRLIDMLALTRLRPKTSAHPNQPTTAEESAVKLANIDQRPNRSMESNSGPTGVTTREQSHVSDRRVAQAVVRFVAEGFCLPVPYHPVVAQGVEDVIPDGMPQYRETRQPTACLTYMRHRSSARCSYLMIDETGHGSW